MLELDDALDQKGLVGLGCQHERLLLCIRCHQEVLQLLYTLSHRCVLLCLVVSVRLVGLKLGVCLPMSLLFCLNLFLLCLNLLVLLLPLLRVARPLLLLLISHVGSSPQATSQATKQPADDGKFVRG